MNKFRKPHGSGNRSFGGDRGGRPSFGGGGRPSFGGARESSGEKFDAICASCGKKCQVPFHPNGKKPVYCSDCFGKQRREETPGGGEGRDSFPKRDFAPRPSFESRPERTFVPRENSAPRDAAPMQAPRQDDRAIADLKQQVSIIAQKLDSVLRILQATGYAPATAQVATPAPVITKPVTAKPMIVTKPDFTKPKKNVPAKKKGPSKR